MRMICSKRPEVLYGMVVLAAACGLAPPNLALAQKPQKKLAEVSHPPKLPGGVESLTITGPELLKPTETLLPGVEIAKTPPTVDVLYYPGQDYPGNPWSVWGDSVATPGKYYSSFGDHISPAGNAYVFEYDAATKKFRKLFQVTETLKTAEGHYRPGKIHGRLDFGADGRLYFATHRGSERTTNDDYHFQGDWIIAADPQTAKAEIIAHAPLAKHCIPNSMVDGERMIFYGGTAPGRDAEVKDIMFFAYDLKNRKLLYSGANGPSRAMMLAKSTGRVYFTGGEAGKADGQLLRFDPAQPGTPVALPIRMGLRAASDETKEGKIYAVSQNPGKRRLYRVRHKDRNAQDPRRRGSGGRELHCLVGCRCGGAIHVLYSRRSRRRRKRRFGRGPIRSQNQQEESHRLLASDHRDQSRRDHARHVRFRARSGGRQTLHHLERQS